MLVYNTQMMITIREELASCVIEIGREISIRCKICYRKRLCFVNYISRNQWGPIVNSLHDVGLLVLR